SVTISTETSGTSLLFLSDSYYPGWQAYVDDIKTPIYRANFIFRAVSVPEGTHTVRFVYDPLSWKLGLYLSSAGILIFFLWILRKQ
ncbi:MAG: hypothetical protein ACD_36C00102G0001, partial [uncultured bacterium]